jgi:pimeloyl-ACP methyl ester carboxylesterase
MIQKRKQFLKKFIQLNISGGVEIAFLDEGNKNNKTLFFVHGLASESDVWLQNIEYLLQHNFRCIAIDLPGHGDSEIGKFSYSVFFYSSVVGELIQKLNLENVTIIGHSMGGQVSIVTALRFPDKISELILSAPAGFEVFTESERHFLETSSSALFGETLLQAYESGLKNGFFNFSQEASVYTKKLFGIADATRNQFPMVIENSVKGMLREAVYENLDKITQPVLIIFGENDRLIPNTFFHKTTTAEIAKLGTSQIPNAKLVLLQNCGHFPQFEKANEFNKEVEKFVK